MYLFTKLFEGGFAVVDLFIFIIEKLRQIDVY